MQYKLNVDVCQNFLICDENCLAKAQQLPILPTYTDIFDIQQHHVFHSTTTRFQRTAIRKAIILDTGHYITMILQLTIE